MNSLAFRCCVRIVFCATFSLFIGGSFASGQPTREDANGGNKCGADTACASISAIPFIVGVDVSFLPELESSGAIFSDQGFAGDALAILQSHGVNTIRARLWHTPNPDVSSLAEVTALGARAKAAGMAFHLDFHYSDWWADPGHQLIPAAWSLLDFDTLVDSVYEYSKYVTETLVAAGAAPDAVQLGNEIAGGMLWDYGKVGGAFDTPTQWTRLVQLLNAGKNGVNDGLGALSTQFIVHIDHGANLNTANWFYGKLDAYNFDFDIIGLTFFPWWQGTLDKFSTTINGLAANFGKPIVLVETAYPWTLDADDSTNNTVNSSSQLHSGYPATVAGQTAFLEAVVAEVKSIPSDLGRGVMYWAGDYTSSGSLGSFWENVALFDFSGALLSSISALEDAALPIELTAFTARVDGNVVVLNWSFRDSRDIVSVGVQQEIWDEFQTIETIFPSPSGVHGQQFTVTGASAGLHRFRLELVQSDGLTEYSDILELSVLLDEAVSVSNVFPNPFSGRASIDFRPRNSQYVRVDVFTADGRLVDSLYNRFTVSGEKMTVDLMNDRWAPGIYFVIVSGDRFRELRKAVKL